MKRINKIRLQNFKAFKDQEFDFKGKHVLIYGNNGSGKSSLFWALYTILQSSIKGSDDDVKKYFEHFVPSNTDTHQSLKNIYVGTSDMSSIEIDVKKDDEEPVTYKIDKTDIGTNPDNNSNDTTIQELNLASDFINYKLLYNFYKETHKQSLNLWSVFERDIFPFLADGAQNWLKDIIKDSTLDVPRTTSGKVVSQNKKQNFIEELNELNIRIQTLLTEIQDNANIFMKKHFFENKDVIKVSLSFNNKFKFDNVRNKMWDDDKTSYRHNELSIKLTVEVNDDEITPNWRKIERVQSFLNEAQLTRIAIAIRIGALRTRVQGTEFKILVLDDMLISLDMSNRMDIVRIFLNTENDPDLETMFGGFQKIILTHDLGFYELIKRYTSPHEWEYLKLHTTEEIQDSPKVKIDKSRIEKAQAFLVDGEYDACGNELRKETEAVLDKYLKGLKRASEGEFEPLMNKLSYALKDIEETNRKDFNKLIKARRLDKTLVENLNTNFNSNGDLTPAEKGKLNGLRSDIIKYLIKQIEYNNDKARLVSETKDILKRIMNPASHSSLVPIYEGELRKAIDGVNALKDILNN